ncbi:MAG: TonB-dependent receptor [Thermodesulfobacteriota bacterium]|nr:TonB-dependent receptor [Thermodesulfobacteriota bacterium]
MKRCCIFFWIVFLIISVPAGAETIYVIATPLYEDTTEVEIEPTAFAQSINVRRYLSRFTTTEEVLKGAVGANVRSIGGLGSYSTISIRGASANQCLVLIDGLRLNSPSGGGVDISKIPLSEVERIDIIRGSDSALFGESALGGIVNIITKDPTERFSADISSTFGSYGTREVRVGAGGPLGDSLGFMLNMSRRHSDNNYEFENNNGTENDPLDDFKDTRRNNAFDDTSYMAKLMAGGDSWRLKALASVYSSHKEIPGIITFPTPRAEQEFKRGTYHISAQAKPIDEFSLDVDISRVDQDDTYKDPDAPLWSDTETLSDQLSLGLGYTVGHLLVYPKFTYLEEGMDDSSMGSRTRYTRSALMRLDFGREPFEMITTIRNDNNSQFGSKWTYRSGISWSIFDWIMIKANAGQGYRTPSFYELYYNHGFIVGNQSLKPEESFSWDIGPSIEHDYFGVSVNYFNTRYDDLITYILQSGFYYKPYNVSRARAKGIELYAWLEPVEGIRLSGNYTFNKMLDTTGEPNRDGNQIPGKPRNIANVQLDLTRNIKGRQVGMYASYNYTEGNFVTRANTKKLGDRRVFNLGLNFYPIERLSLNIEAGNVFDKYVTDIRGFPLEGRAFYFTARMEM